ncbi:MAG: glycyl-radical enzyme activating protein [Oscillospiraceae bacterium]|jgi:pyruvate formate lyase activating enzyme|nr:glycyl-radical enzyme activating protein [Oscillospiraceae bacterium]
MENTTTLPQGTIFNIQHFSLHDGPGIRTVVFLKGCPLRCRWCCNPESQSFVPEPAFDATKCIHCGACDTINQPFDCPTGARFVYGTVASVSEILDEVERDAAFWKDGGGLTLSGGEPLAQPDFCLALLREAKRRYIPTAMETCGHAPWEILRTAADALDYILYDVKSLDSAKHKTWTGVGNAQILENLHKLCRDTHPPIKIRTPKIPDFNEHEIGDIAALAASLGCAHEVLPYHDFGRRKYEMLARF